MILVEKKLDFNIHHIYQLVVLRLVDKSLASLSTLKMDGVCLGGGRD